MGKVLGVMNKCCPSYALKMGVQIYHLNLIYKGTELYLNNKGTDYKN